MKADDLVQLQCRHVTRTLPGKQANSSHQENSYLRNALSKRFLFKIVYEHKIHGFIRHAKSLQSCPTLCNPTDSSPPGSAVPGILQARTLEWVAMSFSNARKWKVKVKSLSCVWLSATPWTAAHQSPPSMGFSRQEYWSGVPLPSPTWTRNLFFSKQFADEFYNQEKKLNTNLKRSETCQNLQLIKNMKSRELWIDEQSLLPSLMGCQSWRSPTCLLEIDRTLHCYVATLSFENGFIHNVSVYRSNHLSCLTRSLWYTIYYN